MAFFSVARGSHQRQKRQSLMARDFDRQISEIQLRCAVLTRYTVLGILITEVVA